MLERSFVATVAASLVAVAPLGAQVLVGPSGSTFVDPNALPGFTPAFGFELRGFHTPGTAGGQDVLGQKLGTGPFVYGGATPVNAWTGAGPFTFQVSFSGGVATLSSPQLSGGPNAIPFGGTVNALLVMMHTEGGATLTVTNLGGTAGGVPVPAGGVRTAGPGADWFELYYIPDAAIGNVSGSGSVALTGSLPSTAPLNATRLTFVAGTFQATVIPEPGTVLLLGTGLVGLGAAAWGRRRRGPAR